MKNAIILIIVAISSLFILGYSIHMLIGGLVSEENERWAIIGVCTVGGIILTFMGIDIVKQQRNRSK